MKELKWLLAPLSPSLFFLAWLTLPARWESRIDEEQGGARELDVQGVMAPWTPQQRQASSGRECPRTCTADIHQHEALPHGRAPSLKYHLAQSSLLLHPHRTPSLLLPSLPHSSSPCVPPKRRRTTYYPTALLDMIIPQDHVPLRGSDINLDISGVAGFFGGDVAVSAMATVHIYKARKWLGWYNSPGSYEIAKRFGQLVRSRLWSGLYPGVRQEPAVLFELDGGIGPRYRGLHSGTIMAKTGHLAYLFAEHCKTLPLQTWDNKDTRVTSPVSVTIAELCQKTPDEREEPLRKGRLPDFKATTLLSLIPIFASVATSLLCGFANDNLVVSMITLGMLANGLSCLAIGWGELVFINSKPAVGAPPANGILDDSSQIIIVRGTESMVTTITRGGFTLKYEGHSIRAIGWSSVLLTCQFLVQLLAVPQGSIFGQVMFLCSLAVSWAYNSYLSSIDRVSLQRHILVDKILERPPMYRFMLGTRTTMVVFVLLVLSAFQDKAIEPEAIRAMLEDLLPNNTPAWRSWKSVILSSLEATAAQGSEFPDVPPFEREPGSTLEDTMLDTLYKDAEAARKAYSVYCQARKSSARSKGHEGSLESNRPKLSTDESSVSGDSIPMTVVNEVPVQGTEA